MNIALDVGGVILKPTNRSKDKSELVENVVEHISSLSESNNLWILSSCSLKSEDEIRTALLTYNINKYIPEEKWIFVRSRDKKVKKLINDNIDVLIDDNSDTIKSVKKAKKVGILFTDWETVSTKI